MNHVQVYSRYMSVKEAARCLDYTVRHIYTLIEIGELDKYQRSRKCAIHLSREQVEQRRDEWGRISR